MLFDLEWLFQFEAYHWNIGWNHRGALGATRVDAVTQQQDSRQWLPAKLFLNLDN